MTCDTQIMILPFEKDMQSGYIMNQSGKPNLTLELPVFCWNLLL